MTICPQFRYFLYGAPKVNFFTDYIALKGLFAKPLGDIKNKTIRAMVEGMMCFNLEFHHIPGTKNAIADCMSRLTRKIREAEHFSLTDPILAYKSKIETEDPWVKKLTTAAMADPEYVAMIAHIELRTELGDIPKDCEPANMSNNWEDLSVATIKGLKL